MSRSKQDADAARSYAKWLTNQQLRGFDYDQERNDAKLIAELYSLGERKAAFDTLRITLDITGNMQRVLHLVLDELKGKRTKSDVTTQGFNIIRAYIAACAFDHCAALTLHDVRMEYVRLFIKEQQPRDMTVRGWLTDLEKNNKIPHRDVFRRILTRYGASIRKDLRGRPREIIRY